MASSEDSENQHFIHLHKCLESKFHEEWKECAPEFTSSRVISQAQLDQARSVSIGEKSASVRNIRNIRICMGKKPIVSVTYENERISMKTAQEILSFS